LIEETLTRARLNKEEADQLKIEWTRYDLDLAGLGISLIDFKPHELCYISFDSIKFVSDSLKIFQESKKDAEES